MKGFKVDEKGDIVFENGSIALVENDELKAQTLRTVMATNKGEWFLNENEGVDFKFLLGKGITEEMRLAQCNDACNQVDANLHILNFKTDIEKASRKSSIRFTAQSGDTVINASQSYGEDIVETNANASSKLALANAQMSANRSAVEKLERRLSGR